MNKYIVFMIELLRYASAQTNAFCTELTLQSSAVITRSTIVSYYISIHKNWVRISISGFTKATPYLARRSSYGMAFVNICERIDRVITASHCISKITRSLPFPAAAC